MRAVEDSLSLSRTVGHKEYVSLELRLRIENEDNTGESRSETGTRETGPGDIV